MRMIVVDPAMAGASGLAVFDLTRSVFELLDVGEVRAAKVRTDGLELGQGKDGLRIGVGLRGVIPRTEATRVERSIWRAVFGAVGADVLVIEARIPGGKGYSTALKLEKQRGEIATLAVEAGVNPDHVIVVPVTTWRAVAGLSVARQPGDSGDAVRKRWKEAAAVHVAMLVRGGMLPGWAGGALTSDQHEAVCIGVAVERMLRARYSIGVAVGAELAARLRDVRGLL